MQAVILCGGKGTRLSEETKLIPKPMVEIGGKPILWHIMKLLSFYNVTDFIIAAGYKIEVIKKNLNIFNEFKKVQLVDTGAKTLTGGRILRLKKFFQSDENFIMTYGDGLSDIRVDKLINFHKKHKKIATVTAVHPPVRFGELELHGDKVQSFEEKPQAKAGWINGGFFVLNSKIFNYIENDQTIFEREPLTKLSKESNLMAFKHEGFWQCMDTKRDKINLEKIYKSKNYF